MRSLLFMAAALLLGCDASLAQVSTMGTTAMGLPSIPATIVTSPLYGPGPFSATTLPGAPDTTLAPVPLASDPTIPGTVVTCATPIAQIAPGTQAVTVTSPSTPQPATLPALPSPSLAATPLSMSSTVFGAVATSATIMSPTAMTPATPLGTIFTPIVVTTTGNVSPTSPLGTPSTIVCSSIPGGLPTNGAALPLSTPEIPLNPPPGTIQQEITLLGGTSIDPIVAVMPTPNTSACAESMTMNFATPGRMAPANASGAAATPGVMPPGC
jgi:hypothetical protein